MLESPAPKEKSKKEESTKAAPKSKGRILLPDETLVHRKPIQERTGKEHEQAALDAYNERLQLEYNENLALAKDRGVNLNLVPKAKVYTVADVFASKLQKDEVNGDRVGIILNDSKKFYYQL